MQRGAKKYREISRTGNTTGVDRIEFRWKIKIAKRSFYQKKIEDASKARDIFEIAKWHKSKGTYSISPLIDPLDPDSSPAQTLEQKRKVFLKNLLSNQSHVEDIPLDTPAIPRKSLPFRQLIISEVLSAILGASNTTVTAG